ncbi:response regulator transcription factor [Enterococcus sp. DIV0242_7C1]|uniref:OmpR/PhoB-type domain-containing protein n=1 Tax=Candidatus Enterococcus dunnyi TaxID=1834192 RepID=A0A200J0I2_9ENTE|nr:MULTISPECIES: winged helix-turn-helix domain-containing protein [unclassified Enterococcus]MBO0470284.1 response regulator transcription factor [Enterococcus sp. DIV0242_7C1]OUZ30349.1 hypothetical protein A5889_002637 [Enterococcus sp. 9D6_DIV0238]
MRIGIISLSENSDFKKIENYTNKEVEFIHVTLKNLEELPIEQTEIIYVYDKDKLDIREYCDCILKIRKKKMIPIIFMINSVSKIDRLILLKMGVTAFVDLDYDVEELVLTAENNLNLKLNFESEEKELGEISFQLDEGNRSVLLNEEVEVGLTKIEYKLLSTIYSDKATVFSYEKLFNEIWNCESKKRNVDLKDMKTKVANVVFHLRTKFKLAGVSHEYIQTVRSRGYRFYMTA